MFDHQIAVVEAYINHRTGRQVRINPHNINVVLLMKAYNHAANWFNENNGTLTLV